MGERSAARTTESNVTTTQCCSAQNNPFLGFYRANKTGYLLFNSYRKTQIKQNK